MKLLILTNFYPPAERGWGYGQLCEEVVDGLAARGHTIRVLTSTAGPSGEHPYPVHRELPLDPDWHSGRWGAVQFALDRRPRERQALVTLERHLADFRPDIIFVWHAIGLSRMLLARAEADPRATTVYYLAGYLPELPDEYVAYWEKQPVRPIAKLVKRPLAALAHAQLRREGKPVPLRYRHVICISRYVRDRLQAQSLIPADAVVIHNGIDTARFRPPETPRTFDPPLRLLYAGRLEAEKGVHLILEALHRLPPTLRAHIAGLHIVGSGVPAYTARLHELVAAYDLGALVHFAPPIPRAEMPALLATHDILLLPSDLESLSRMMQEALAAGMLLIGTDAGGGVELLRDGETGLVCRPGDAASLADKLAYALQQPAYGRAMAAAGQALIQSEFDIRRCVAQIEAYLAQRVAGA